ncbi:DUF3999 family protein [Caldimonas brevitalea]|uniref:Transmembrane protein n=1 Tax=Caldimonas brevitalea TaxID=413882 RepID=A0A0G3BWF9_9BURK|nr:DUF3999 family protein [Caldimonas brevitalea]AKJ30845.1 transmembrane protein [Caldimonas brevitalea]
MRRRPTPRRYAGLFACLVTWALTPAAFGAGGAELVLHGTGPYFTLQLPIALPAPAAAAASPNNLRVLNGRGEVLPFAWDDEAAPVAVEQLQTVPLFKLPGARAANDRPRAGAEPGWILDTREVSGTLQRLELELPESTRGMFTLQVSASDDLQQWRVVRAAAPVVALQHAGQTLRQTTIELAPLSARYLKLSLAQPGTLPELIGARVASLREQARGPELQWTDPIMPSRCDARHCDYPLPPRLPVEQLQVMLHEANTLALIEVLGSVDPEQPVAAAARHGLREQLRAVRRKTEPAAEPASERHWVGLAAATVYWLRLPEAELKSPPLPLAGSQHAQLRLSSAVPISQLGRQPPMLRAAARTRSLVFLARGPGPYQLSWDAPPAGPPALTLTQLMPGRAAAAPLPTDRATVMLARSAAVAVSPGPTLTVPQPSHPRAAAPSGAPGLWAVLFGGLALMAWMARSLLKRPVRQDARARAPSDRP